MNNYTLITGAAGGLGKAFAVECAKLGHNLFLTDLCGEKLETLSNTLQSTYDIKVNYFPCNLTDMEARQELFGKITQLNAELSMAINVAGLDYEGEIESLSSQMISTVIRLNTEATLDITRFAASLPHTGKYYIINVASMAGFFSMPLKAMYAASKRAIIQFSLAIREEIKDKGGNVLSLCPSGLRTMPEVIASIESQGFLGRITTVNTGTVAHKTIKKAKRGQAKYVPGVINMILVGAAQLVPDIIKAKIIYRRWEATRKKALGGL
jgi:short-subunit dehydrogenase